MILERHNVYKVGHVQWESVRQHVAWKLSMQAKHARHHMRTYASTLR